MIFRPLVIQYSNYFTEFKKSIKQYYGLTSLRNLLFIKPNKKLYYQDNLETEFCLSHPDWGVVQNPPATYPPSTHTHDYTGPNHLHDDRYFTESEITTSLSGKAATTTTLSTTAPLAGGGDLSANRTLTISAATTGAAGSMSAADKTKLDGIETAATADMTAAEILTAIKTVDGAASDLDADLLDGQSSEYYQSSTNQNAGTLPDARLSANVAMRNSGNTFAGDIVTHRNNTTGVIYLGNTGVKYLYYDGVNYALNGANLYVNGYLSYNGGTMGLGCAVVRSTDLAIAHNTETYVTFTGYNASPQVANLGPYWDGATRLYAREAGYYIVDGWIGFYGNNAGNHRILTLVRNGIITLASQRQVTNAQFGTGWAELVISTVAYLAAGDWVTLSAYQDTGGNLSLIGTRNELKLYCIWR